MIGAHILYRKNAIHLPELDQSFWTWQTVIMRCNAAIVMAVVYGAMTLRRGRRMPETAEALEQLKQAQYSLTWSHINTQDAGLVRIMDYSIRRLEEMTECFPNLAAVDQILKSTKAAAPEHAEAVAANGSREPAPRDRLS